jgi:hypothetical protein
VESTACTSQLYYTLGFLADILGFGRYFLSPLISSTMKIEQMHSFHLIKRTMARDLLALFARRIIFMTGHTMGTEADPNNTTSIAPLSQLMATITDGNKRNALAACRLRGVMQSISDLEDKLPNFQASELAQINQRLLKITEDLMAR